MFEVLKARKIAVLSLFCILVVSCLKAQIAPKPQAFCYPRISSNFKINNISGGLTNGLEFFRNFDNARFEFPAGSGKTCLGPSAFWLTGIQEGGALVGSTPGYDYNTEFTTGPLDLEPIRETASCDSFQRIWKITSQEIATFLMNFKNGYVSKGSYVPSRDFMTWPANNRYGLQKAYLAPFVDVNNDGVYDPKGSGDYPDIKGDIALFYIANGNGMHMSSRLYGTSIQYNVMLYGYTCDSLLAIYPFLKNTLFINYKLMNTSHFSLTKTYAGLWSLSGIGNNEDDYIGSNPKNGYAYFYNRTSFDSIYGHILPATASVLLKGPRVDFADSTDNNENGLVDEEGETITTPGVYYYYDCSNEYNPVCNPLVNTIQKSPDIGIHYHYYLSGRWKDFSPVTCGGNGSGGTQTTTAVFTGKYDTTCAGEWTEMSAGNPKNKRALILSAGPFAFKSKTLQELEYAVMVAVDSTQPANNLAAVWKLQTEVPKLKAFYNSEHIPCIRKRAAPKIAEEEFEVFPNPYKDLFYITGAAGKTAVIRYLFGTVVSSNYLEKEEEVIYSTQLPDGIYILSIYSGQEPPNVFKLVKH